MVECEVSKGHSLTVLLLSYISVMIYDVTIIGGGIVGLATAYKILEQQPGLKLAVLEKESTLASHQTDRNSGVMHSGIYYKPGSAKAINCVKGHSLLIDFCTKENIPFELCGKVIVAVEESEFTTLENIFKRGIENGLSGIRMIDAYEVRTMEPHCAARRGIWVPQAGIIDFHVVAQRLAQLIQSLGGVMITNFNVNKIVNLHDAVEIQSDHQKVISRLAIGCAGLYSDRLARLAGAEPPHQIVPFRGEFYSLIPSAEKLVRGLIYPVPDVNFPFLGVHLTKRIRGGIEAGPNAVLAFRREGYEHFDVHWGELAETLRYRGFHRLAKKHWRKGIDEMKRSFSKKAFLKSLQRLVPELTIDMITRSRTGVRAQAIDRNGNMVDDYVVVEQEHMIHVLNAPSPAATSCLSIGLYISVMALRKLYGD